MENQTLQDTYFGVQGLNKVPIKRKTTRWIYLHIYTQSHYIYINMIINFSSLTFKTFQFSFIISHSAPFLKIEFSFSLIYWDVTYLLILSPHEAKLEVSVYTNNWCVINRRNSCFQPSSCYEKQVRFTDWWFHGFLRNISKWTFSSASVAQCKVGIALNHQNSR